MAPFFDDLVIVTDSPKKFNEAWTLNQVKAWIHHAGGEYHSQISQATTHLVVTATSYNSQTSLVEDALRVNKCLQEGNPGGQLIHIVSWDWLDDSLSNRSKKSEKRYYLATLYPAVEDRSTQTSDERKEPRSTQGMVNELYRLEADRAFTAEEKVAMEVEDSKARELRIEKKEKDAKRIQELKRAYREEQHRSVFYQGALRAKSELMSDKHHIYQDSLGFRLNVTLTKILTRQNRNQRCVLTIYESNDIPYTYSMVAQHSGTGEAPATNIVASIGSTFETTWRLFVETFSEKTGVDWDNRVDFAIKQLQKYQEERNQRIRARQLGIPQQPHANSQKAKKKQPNEELEQQFIEERLAFAKAKFQYQPPVYGPIGRLPLNREWEAQLYRALRMAKVSPMPPPGRPPPPPPPPLPQPREPARESSLFREGSSGVDGIAPFSLNVQPPSRAATVFFDNRDDQEEEFI